MDEYKIVLVLLIFLSTFAFVNAQLSDPYPVNVRIEVIGNGTGMNVPINYVLRNQEDNASIAGRVITSAEGTFILDAKPGYDTLKVNIDLEGTEGNDYFGEAEFFVNESMDLVIPVSPVGSVNVLVNDKDNNPIKDAPVRVDCLRAYGDQGYFRTDEFGAVNSLNLPLGKCTFRAAVEDYVTSSTINITQGYKEDVVLKLEGYAQSHGNNYLVAIIIIIIILAAIAYISYIIKVRNDASRRDIELIKKKISKTSKNIDKKVTMIKSDNEKIASNVKEDIIMALNEKEKKVIRYMLDEQNRFIQNKDNKKEFYVSQANIVYGTRIPKTSLVRILDSLTSKNMISIESIGKLKKITFTEWFDKK